MSFTYRPVRTYCAQPQLNCCSHVTVQFVPDLANTIIGPGVGVTVQTDILGPWLLGSAWSLEVRVPVSEYLLSRGSTITNQGIASIWLNIDKAQDSTEQPAWFPIPPVVAIPVTSTLIARFQSPSNVLIDQGSVSVKWQGTPEGVAYVQAKSPVSAQGGFNASDRSKLDLVLGAVRLVSPPALTGGANLAAQVIDLVRGPPRSFLRRFGSLQLAGRGSFSAQPPGAAHSFGGTWSFVTVPPGYGRDDGQIVEYHRRLVQFAVIRDEATSDEYLDVLEDSHYASQFILWQFPNPREIDYDVAPGVVVLWEWLV